MRLFFSVVVIALAAVSSVQASAIESDSIEQMAVPGAAEATTRCDTCTTTAQMQQTVRTRFATTRNTNVYVINLEAGIIGGVYVNYVATGELTVRSFSVDPVVQQWVSQVGSVYRDNGRSLALKLVVRADGSVYWVKANGTREDLKFADPSIDAISSPTAKSAGPIVTAAPPNSTPIDLRGFQFHEPAFTLNYPAFPSSTYDFAFSQSRNINDFVRGQTAGINQGVASGVINGTVSVSTNAGATTPVASATGGTTVTRALTSTLTVYVPMKDGGYARVSYDKETGEVTLRELVDGQGNQMPINHPSLLSYLQIIDYRFNQDSGATAFDAFRDYMLSHGIPVLNVTATLVGCVGTPDGTVRCTKIY